MNGNSNGNGNGSRNLWEEAFQLAYFIVPNRASACEVAGNAIEKLKAHRSRERRRIYWRGRDTKARKISRSEEDTLQWLVYYESEAYEKDQERNDQQTETDMIIRYVKHLAQMTTGISSFYVNVGLNRLLRSYSTPEAQQVYEFTTEHYPGSEEYRKVKGRLMTQLATRFDRFLEVRTSQYRELKFEPYDDQKPWRNLVEKCLEVFTPWSSKELCLHGLAELAVEDLGSGMHHAGFRKHVDGIETSRCHWFIHSPCYGWLTKKLGLDPPQDRLSVPKFLLKSRNGNGSHGKNSSPDERKTAPLTQLEMQVLKDRMASVQERQQEIALQPLKIVAHGVLCARLDPSADERKDFVIPDGTRLLEVRTDVAENDQLLATHWVDYTESSGIAAGEYAISLKGKRELLFKVVPADSESAQEGGATVVVESRSTSPVAASLRAAEALRGRWYNVPQYAFASIVFAALVWLGVSANYRSKLEQQQSAIQRMTSELASQNTTIEALKRTPVQPIPTVAHYFLPFQKLSLRGEGSSDEPVVTFAPDHLLVSLELPVADEHSLYRATLSSFVEETEGLRENSLKPVKKGNDWIVEFALPSVLVADNTNYLITLTATNGNDKAKNAASRFLFKVRK